ncbi:casein kinase ii subunit beta [Anaeramoeba flamelloides]|uniref:Casein kinase II subunit beta n=1 Tax=Anaeramoeba flamelloides TaxID=1746091 RepID=A0AAV7ZWK0_9EUKA|nr:casein kinase ii subunit beta [Anaeramoeba flamelloides]KAJ6229123.1 casein kinase ii subunit beta [Anaeramoeba flamelloides]
MSDEEEQSWVRWFVSQKDHEVFCKVSEWYYEDNFNLTGLSNFIPYYSLALIMIRSKEYNEEFDKLSKEQLKIVDRASRVLFGLIHARFIITPAGTQLMLKKYEKGVFGTCPRVYCEFQPCLPVGLSDVPGQSSMKLFCPRCEKVYQPINPRHAQFDGAYFGTTFAHNLLNTSKDLKPLHPTHRYVPRIYGFRISQKISRYCKNNEEKKKKNKNKKETEKNIEKNQKSSNIEIIEKK